MAGRRCFSSKITESDPFYALPETAQALYLHLNMHSDDDGFLNNAAGVASRFKGGSAALSKLVDRRFLLKFEDVYVIKHWRISNSLKNDRLKPLAYPSVARRLWVKPNKAYTDHPVPGCDTLFAQRTGSKNGGTGFQPDSAPLPDGTLTQHKPTEPKGSEPNPSLGWDAHRAFGRILSLYPQGHSGNPAAGEEAFLQAVHSPEDCRLLEENLKLWKQSEQWAKEGGAFIPYLSNWILRGVWREKPARMAVPRGASGELGEAELEAIRRVLADDSL